jgi:hypothetical protein
MLKNFRRIIVCVVATLFLSSCSESYTGKHFSVHKGRGGWWAHIEGNAYPFGAWRMDRGPYWFRWMAELEFPIERITKDGPR